MNTLESILKQNSRKFSPIIPQQKVPLKLYRIDFSENNPDLKNINYNNVEQFAQYIQEKLNEVHKHIAYGGYLEDREMYKRAKIFKSGTENRSVHLGIDFWAPAGTPVTAPLDAVIHSFAINPAHGDYGGTIVLQHNLEGHIFYTLYGHLSHQSVAEKSQGQKIMAGQNLGWIGEPNENGYWPPHVHLQLITDMLSYEGDFPGVCTPGNVDYYKQICPDPKYLLGFE